MPPPSPSQTAFTDHIFQEIPSILIGVGPGGLITHINPFTTHITGLNETDLIGQSWKRLFLDEREVQFFVEEDGQKTTFNARLQGADGKIRMIEWLVLNQNPDSPRNDSFYFALIGRDITKDVQNQTQKRQEEKMLALGHLAGGVAHEINNLLQPIIMGAEILEDRVIKDPQAQSTCEAILRNAHAASEIVRDILLFSRAETDPLELDTLPFDPAFDRALKLAKDQLPITIQTTTRKASTYKPAFCTFRQSDLDRILLNLVLNAAQAMDNTGGIHITLDIVLSGADYMDKLEDRHYIKIDISDEGPGIPPENLEMIFNPFYTTKQSGTGLGLTIIYNIIQSWGGAIAVTNTAGGGGACFTIFIPVLRYI